MNSIEKLNEDLIETSKNGMTELVKLVLESGEDIHASEDEPLRCAAKNGHTEIIKMLIEAGADINVIDDDGDDIMYYANRNKNKEMINLIKSKLKGESK